MLDDLGLLLSRAHVLGCPFGEEPHGLEELQRASSPLLPLGLPPEKWSSLKYGF